MNAPSPGSPSKPALPLKPRWIAAACVLLVVYLLLRPWLVERYGWDLPGFTDVKPAAESGTSTSPAERKEERRKANRPIEVPVIPEPSETVIEQSTEPVNSGDAGTSVANAETAGSPGKSVDSSPSSASKSPPQVVKTPSPGSGKESAPRAPPTTTPGNKSSSKPKSPSQSSEKEKTPDWGVLTQRGRDRFESTEGLIYNQYRIDHVLEHTRDNPDKPSHGVFDVTTQEEVLALVDEAYSIAKKRGPPQVVTEEQGDRTTYTVNLNRKIGRAGGQSGARNRNRALHKLKLVVEDDEVVTAYPTN